MTLYTAIHIEHRYSETIVVGPTGTNIYPHQPSIAEGIINMLLTL